MFSENPPIFVPSGTGFKAVYNLTFSNDLQRLIYLMGGLQGSPVEAKTLMVDNGSNSSACTVSLRGQTIPVAAYTVRYIDCSGAMDLIVTGGAASAVITLEVLTYSMPESVVVKKSLNVGGRAPISISGTTGLLYTAAPLRVLQKGNGITSWLSITLLNDRIYYGMTSTVELGRLDTGGVPLEIPYDDSKEFWIRSVNGAGSSSGISYYGG